MSIPIYLPKRGLSKYKAARYCGVDQLPEPNRKRAREQLSKALFNLCIRGPNRGGRAGAGRQGPHQTTQGCHATARRLVEKELWRRHPMPPDLDERFRYGALASLGLMIRRRLVLSEEVEPQLDAGELSASPALIRPC
jgi:hypothetical protein